MPVLGFCLNTQSLIQEIDFEQNNIWWVKNRVIHEQRYLVDQEWTDSLNKNIWWIWITNRKKTLESSMLLDRETKNSEKGKEETCETIFNKKFRKRKRGNQRGWHPFHTFGHLGHYPVDILF
jgi:S-adenosylmethionine:diacylglycerol 3-amino-3-carboxypropyl transferase